MCINGTNTFFSAVYTLENLCTRTAQSSRVGYNRRGHIIVHFAVKKGNILSIFYI